MLSMVEILGITAATVVSASALVLLVTWAIELWSRFKHRIGR